MGYSPWGGKAVGHDLAINDNNPVGSSITWMVSHFSGLFHLPSPIRCTLVPQTEFITFCIFSNMLVLCAPTL